MANVKKVYEDAEGTTQFYPQTHEKAVVDNNGTTAETKFQMITDLVNQKQMEVGAVPIDFEPTLGNTTHVVNSDGVYRALDKVEETNVFTNSADVTWNTGNISSGNIVTTYANKYIIINLPVYTNLIIHKGSSTYTLGVYRYVSGKWSGIKTVANNETYITDTQLDQILLLLYDKPSDASAKAVEITVDTLLIQKHLTHYDVTDTIDGDNDKVVSAFALKKELRSTTVTNENLTWLSGNIENGSITSYGNKYTNFSFDYPVDKIHITLSNLSTSYHLTLYKRNGTTYTSIKTLSLGDDIVKLSEPWKDFCLLCWDSPSNATVNGIEITMTYKNEAVKTGNVTSDFFSVEEDEIGSAYITGNVSKSVFIEKLTTDNGFTWVQGGINSSTGEHEGNSGAIHTSRIYLYGDEEVEVVKGAITGKTGVIAVYDEHGTYKLWNASADNLQYFNGSIIIVFYGSGSLAPSSGASAGTSVVRHKMLENRLKAVEDEMFTNPVLAADFPDPTVWDGEDGYYYALATGGISTRKLMRSANLVNWENSQELPYTSDVAESIVTAFSGTTSYWAPCVYKVKDGQWNMYLSKPYGGVIFLTSKYPTMGYNVVRMTSAPFNDYIDADVARDRDGKLWMFAGSAAKMFRRQLTDDGLDFAEDSSWVHVAGRPSGEGGNTHREKTFEGEYLYRRKGYWYLFCSSGEYGNNTYAIRVVRASTLDGTFTDKSGNLATDGYAETIMTSASRFYGPGHNAQIVVDKNGDTWMLYHSHYTGVSSSVRVMMLDKVLWDEDGWPYFYNNGKPSLFSKKPKL